MKCVGIKTTISVKQQLSCRYKNNMGTKTTAHSKQQHVKCGNFLSQEKFS